MVGLARGPNVIPMCGRFVTMISDSLFVFETIGLRFEQIIEYRSVVIENPPYVNTDRPKILRFFVNVNTDPRKLARRRRENI